MSTEPCIKDVLSIVLRFLFLLIWTSIIFICTCSASIEDVLLTHRIEFIWNSHPVFSEILNPLPSDMTMYFILRKVGHALSFLIFTIAVYLNKPSYSISGISAFAYALLTEILQLFFMRDGRLFDVGFDSAGIVGALFLIWVSKVWTLFRNRIRDEYSV